MWPFKEKVQKPEYTLVLYMRSGNRITLDGILEYEFKCESSGVSSISLEWSNDCAQRLLVKTIDLSQIEAVTVLK